MSQQSVLISKLGRRLKVNPKTIRYYEEIELLPEPARNPSCYRVYSDRDVERLDFILRAKALDFSLFRLTRLVACSPYRHSMREMEIVV